MSRRLLSGLSALAALLTLVSPLAADDAAAKRPFTLADLYRVAGVADPALSPDSKSVVYAVTTNDVKAGTRTQALWRVDAGGGPARPITFSGARDSHPFFSPDGKTLAFVSTRAGDPQVFFLPTAGAIVLLFFPEGSKSAQKAWALLVSAATFAAAADKRTTAALAIAHLAEHAPVPQREIALPAGAPFGTILVDRATCTMCLACVGSCPEGALLDGAEKPELRFIETKCVQCGICAATCPERSIALVPRLNLAPDARAPRVVNEAAIFKCIGCGKPLGTEKMVANMLVKLAGHSMFAAPGALDRLKMCADCRVIDLVKSEGSLDIRDV